MERNLAIEHAEVYTVQAFSQRMRLIHIITQTNVNAPRHVFDCLSFGHIVVKLVKSLLTFLCLNCFCFALLFEM